MSTAGNGKVLRRVTAPGCAELVDGGIVAVPHDRLENAGYGNRDDCSKCNLRYPDG